MGALFSTVLQLMHYLVLRFQEQVRLVLHNIFCFVYSPGLSKIVGKLGIIE